MVAPSVRYHDLPISTYTGWDKVQQVEGVIIQHDYGQLRSSAMFCDSLMRDDRINATVETRVGALMAAPVECTPADDSANASKYAEEIGGSDTRPGRWNDMFTQAVMSGLSFWGSMIGIGIAEIIWRTDDTTRWTPTSTKGTDYSRKRGKGAVRWTPRLKLWHPQFLYWDWGNFRWMLLCQEGTVPLPNTDEQPHSDGKWVIYTPRGYQYGWLRALLRPLAYKYLMRGWNYRDWARFNERHGQPILGAITPKDADDDVKAEFVNSVRLGAADAVVELPQDNSSDNGDKFDLKLIESKGRSFDSFDKFKTQLDTDIAITVLGQNLTTEGGAAGGGGSKALGEVQNQVRLDKRREDAVLADVIREQVLYWDALFNHGDGDLAPRPAYQVDPPEDETEEGMAFKALGDGITSLNAAAGGALDVRTMLEEHGLPLLSEEELAANKAAALEEQVARQTALAPPDPVGGPGGPGGGPPKPGAPRGNGGGGGDGPPVRKALRVGEGSLPATVITQRTFQGLPVAIENPAGSLRTWKDGDDIGTTEMLFDYGFIEGVDGSDGEELDVYLGPDETAPDVHVVHQRRAPWGQGDHDEDKTMLGFADAGAAKAAYLAHRNDGDRAWGGMSVIPLDTFKRKLRTREGTGKIRASATPRADARRATVDALEALVVRVGRASTALRAAPKGHGIARAKRYPDQLERNAVAVAARALGADIVGIRGEIEKATSYEDLRARVKARYRDKMSPDVLAEIVRKTDILAQLGGRLTALKQV